MTDDEYRYGLGYTRGMFVAIRNLVEDLPDFTKGYLDDRIAEIDAALEAMLRERAGALWAARSLN